MESTQQLTVHNPPAVSDASCTIHSAEPRLPPPTVHSGEPHLCRPFLTKCSLYFSLQPSSFPTEESKIAFAITLLSGRATLWGTMVWDNKQQCVSSFQAFSSELIKVFDRAASGREVARLLDGVTPYSQNTYRLFYRVLYFGSRMQLECRGSVGHVFGRTCSSYPKQNLCPGFTHLFGWAY